MSISDQLIQLDPNLRFVMEINHECSTTSSITMERFGLYSRIRQTPTGTTIEYLDNESNPMMIRSVVEINAPNYVKLISRLLILHP